MIVANRPPQPGLTASLPMLRATDGAVCRRRYRSAPLRSGRKPYRRRGSASVDRVRGSRGPARPVGVEEVVRVRQAEGVAPVVVVIDRGELLGLVQVVQ